MGVNIILSSISVVLVTVTGKAHDVPRSHRLIDCRPPPLTPSPLCSYRRRSVGRSACMPQASAVVQSGLSDRCRLALWQSNIRYYFVTAGSRAMWVVAVSLQVVTAHSLLATRQTETQRESAVQPNDNNISL